MLRGAAGEPESSGPNGDGPGGPRETGRWSAAPPSDGGRRGPLDYPAMGGFVVLGAVVWVVCIIVTVGIARQKGRRAWVWALLGILAGPLAMFAVFIMDPVRGSSRPRR